MSYVCSVRLLLDHELNQKLGCTWIQDRWSGGPLLEKTHRFESGILSECVYSSHCETVEVVFGDSIMSRSVSTGCSGNFEPMSKQVEAWQRSLLSDVSAKVSIYEGHGAFVEGRLEDSEVVPTVNLYRLCGIASAEKW